MVTLTGLNKNRECDVQLPCNQSIDDFKADLLETVNQYFGEDLISTSEFSVYCERLNKKIDGNVSIKDSELLNGDYIRLV